MSITPDTPSCSRPGCDCGDARTRAAGTLAISEAAQYVGVSEALLRKREDEGVIAPFRYGAKRERRYTIEQLNEWSDAGLLTRRPPGRVSQRVVLPERVPLSYEDEQEALRIAQAVTTSIVRRVGSVEWDDAFSDALLGVAIALSRPTADCPWNVSCFTHARWAVLTGISRRAGLPSGEYAKGRRWTDLPPERQPPTSLDALIAETSAAKRTALDNTPRLLDRVVLEGYLAILDKRQRTVLINSAAHRFTDQEIAAELGVSRSYVQQIRQAALATLREAMEEPGENCA